MTTYPAHAYGGVPVGEYYGGSAPSRVLTPAGTHQVPGWVADPDVEVKDQSLCQYEKADGSQCRQYPKGGEIYCGIHLRTMRTLDAMDAVLDEVEVSD